MQKIMFNKPYGLQHAVECGYKTMDRHPVGKRMTEDDIRAYLKGYTELANKCAQYKIGEVVAVAQSYKDCGYDSNMLQLTFVPQPTIFPDLDPYHPYQGWVELPLKYHKGWNNKMFVSASMCNHQIRITDIKVERLQDCSDDDILKEGIFQISAPIYRHYNGIGYTFKGWTDRGVECSSDTPKGAFKALIDKTRGRGTFESNPYVFAYSFKLLD